MVAVLSIAGRAVNAITSQGSLATRNGPIGQERPGGISATIS